MSYVSTWSPGSPQHRMAEGKNYAVNQVNSCAGPPSPPYEMRGVVAKNKCYRNKNTLLGLAFMSLCHMAVCLTRKTTPSLKKKKVKGLHTLGRKIRNIQFVQMSFCRKIKPSHNNSLVVVEVRSGLTVLEKHLYNIGPAWLVQVQRQAACYRCYPFGVNGLS